MALSEMNERARLYTASHGIAIAPAALGNGTDGCVWQTSRKTAIKVFERVSNFETELRCYQIFQEGGITEIKGYAIPKLIDYSRELVVIEMAIVQPPYILDFGKASFKRQQPKFSAEVMRETLAHQKETWGEYWPEVRSILNRLEMLGIYHTDPKPGNIMPANWNPSLD